MHIPEKTIGETQVLSFSEALALPAEDYDPREWLYVPPFYTEYRYILGTRGERPLICVGVNPSTAEPGGLDPTLKSVDRISRGNGYDSFIMFNVCAQRATRPQDMDPVLDPTLHEENMAAFDYALSLSEEPAVWAAWGTIIEQRDYLPDCVREMIRLGRACGARWFTAGRRSKKGHPHHPLYLRSDSMLEPFDAAAYADTLTY